MNAKPEHIERRAALVAALRNGAYTQTRGKLHDKRGFCCLGVACDVSNLSEWSDEGFVLYYYLGHDNTMPKRVVEYYGFNDEGGRFLAGTSAMALWELNDTYMLDFAQIADVIAYEPVGLFVETEELFKELKEEYDRD